MICNNCENNAFKVTTYKLKNEQVIYFTCVKCAGETHLKTTLIKGERLV